MPTQSVRERNKILRHILRAHETHIEEDKAARLAQRRVDRTPVGRIFKAAADAAAASVASVPGPVTVNPRRRSAGIKWHQSYTARWGSDPTQELSTSDVSSDTESDSHSEDEETIFERLAAESAQVPRIKPDALDAQEPDYIFQDEDVDGCWSPAGPGSPRLSIRGNFSSSATSMAFSLGRSQGVEPQAYALPTPRFCLRVQANRPFSAPRIRWTKTEESFATSSPSTARQSADTPRTVVPNPRESIGLRGRPSTARPSTSNAHRGPLTPAKQLRLRPLSAFGTLQRRPQHPLGMAERPPMTPSCAPQARFMLESNYA